MRNVSRSWGLAALTVALCHVPCFATAPFSISVKDPPYNAKGDGTTDDTNAVLSALTAVAQVAGSTVVIPAGSYLLNNNAGEVGLTNFTGTVNFQGGACFLFPNITHGGFRFGDETYVHGGSNIVVLNPCIDYQGTPNTRSTEPALVFDGSTNVYVQNAVIKRGPGPGLVFQQANHMTVQGATITNTGADGCNVSNGSYGNFYNISADTVGDDCLSFVNNTGGANGGNHYANGLTCHNTLASGSSVVGMHDVTVTNFTIDQTGAPGIRVNSDSYTQGFTPTNIVYTSGTITNAGQYGSSGSGNGLLLGDGNTQTQAKVTDVQISNSRQSGVYTSALGTYDLERITVTTPSGTGTPQNGFELYGSVLTGSQLSATNIPDYCFYFGSVGSANITQLTAKNCSMTNSMHRSIWSDNGGTITLTGLSVTDNQTATTGYIVGEHGTTGQAKFLSIAPTFTNPPAFSFSQGTSNTIWTLASACDLNVDGALNLLDIQSAANQALGLAPCSSADLQHTTHCDAVDVQRVVNATLGLTCKVGP